MTDRRYAAGATVLSAGLVISATVALLAAYGFDAAALAHPGSIVDWGQGAADLLRVGGLLDMASYLPLSVLIGVTLHLGAAAWCSAGRKVVTW